MSAIQELPTEKTFGLGFSYDRWEANTAITLCNVPWNSDYRDIVKFESREALNEYLSEDSGPTIIVRKASMAKFGMPIKLDIPHEIAQQYNYIRVENPMQAVPGSVPRAYYYFISHVEYAAPSTTVIYTQLDVWQSFGFDIRFGQCYIERGHIGIAAQNSFMDYGREFLSLPEGLDVGNEYQIAHQWTHKISSARDGATYSVLVMSTVALDADPGTVDNPKLTSARGSNMENMPGGAELYVFGDGTLFKEYMSAMADKPWVTQGIISVTAIGEFARYSADLEFDVVEIGGVPCFKINGGTLENVETTIATNWRNTLLNKLGSRYSYLKKFATFPYSFLELTAYTGTPIVIKPENWGIDDAVITEIPHFVPPGARIMFAPFRYNAGKTAPAATYDTHGLINDGGEFLDMATGIFNFPTFSLVNNGFMSFLASNKNSLAFQHSSADWSQNKAQMGIQTSYDQASAGIGLSQNLTGQSINAANAQTNLQNQGTAQRALLGMVNQVGSVGNGPGGAISAAAGMMTTGIGAAIDMNQNTQSTGISTGLAAGQNRATTDNAAYMRDTNRSLAEYAANGDYSNTIAGIAARVQDAKMTQPTTSGQVGGDSFNLARYKWGYDLKLKMISPAAMHTVGEFWLRYGYNVQLYRSIPESLQVMTDFTFWKLKETYIVASKCPEPFKQSIRGIFEKGVTVWRDPARIGNMDIALNQPMTDVEL